MITSITLNPKPILKSISGSVIHTGGVTTTASLVTTKHITKTTPNDSELLKVIYEMI